MSWTPDEAASYLVDHGHAPAGAEPRARALDGGVSNHVVEVTWDGGCVVVKRPLENLDVDDDWPADVARVHNEAAAIRAYADLFAARGVESVTVPAVQFEDRDTHTVGFECAPDAEMWKAALLDGRVALDVAERVGTALGTVHAGAADETDLRDEFRSYRPFEQLRLDPYHRTVAERHPDVADPVHEEVDRIAGTRRTLVHGDYSPKNVLVGDRVWILDHEVAHWGDPAFDVAFMTNHLLLKAVHCSATGVGSFDAYVDAADRFRSAYRSAVGSVEGGAAVAPPERAVAAELSILLLARLDGKSPVEYLDDTTASAIRPVAKAAIRDRIGSIDALVDRLREVSG